METLRITVQPEISAIYYALLQNGYDFYTLDRSDLHVRRIQSFVTGAQTSDFFAAVRQPGCEVYPYWPRAAILERAVYCLDAAAERFSDFARLRRDVMQMPNVSEDEKGEALWTWMEAFPHAISRVLNDPAFLRYLAWERTWVAEQNECTAEERRAIGTTLFACAKRYGAPAESVELLLQPIKCAYSADYFLHDRTFVYCSGRLDLGSVVHEFLHPIVHPRLEPYRERIAAMALSPSDVDPSYALDGGEAGKRNLFEERLVRRLTARILQGETPNLDDAIRQMWT